VKKFTKISVYIISVLFVFNIGWWGNEYYKSKQKDVSDPIFSQIKYKPLEKYQIENLSSAVIPQVGIKLEREISRNEDFSSHLFSFSFDPSLSGKNEKKVTGLINIPSGKGPFPVILLLRGYVDQSIYQTGTGTKRVGEFFAKNGYLTIAPDFLGYGESDKEAENIFESRFQTYTTALVLLESIKNKNPDFTNINKERIFIWGHSNGGQIAITILEIKGYNYPTVLWAPVTKPFPYSVLYYTDESEDQGKFIRRKLAEFEKEYDVDKFSITGYLNNINARIQLQQGTSDNIVPIDWSNIFFKKLKEIDKSVVYYKHPGADHNMNPLWGDAAEKSLNFFNGFPEVLPY